jgi:starch phosphorylase
MRDAEAWERTENPYFILQSVSDARLEEAAANPEFIDELQRCLAQRQQSLEDPSCWGSKRRTHTLNGVAYFSMEFGLGEALPIYSEGLGIWAGDYLKAASDLGCL